MTFTEPDLLFLVAFLPVAVGFFLFRYAQRRRRVASVMGDDRLLLRLGGHGLKRFPLRRFLLLTLAAAVLGLAAAGPRWGLRSAENNTRSRSIVLALDISKSMLARDVQPNRLERERLIARRVLRDLVTDRIGLVVFAGRAYILSPLTTDHSALQLYVDALDPEMVSQGGSSLASAITQATDLARGAGRARNAAVVLLSDGEALEEDAAIGQAIQRSRRLGIAVHTVGIGTEAGDRIPEIDPRTRKILGYKTDPYGNQVVSRLNEQLLRGIAQQTGGTYFHADQAGGTGALLRTLRDLQRTAGDQRSRTERQDRTGWFIALALLLLALDHVLARRADAQRTPLFGPGAIPLNRAVAAAVLLLVLTGWDIGALERGNRYYRAGRYADAVREYEIALRERADSPELHYNLGTALLQLGRFDEAQQHMQRALLTNDPALRERAHFNTGYRALVTGRRGGPNANQLLDAAIESYKGALRLAPADADAKWNLELALREKERQPQSEQGGQNQPPPQGSEDEQQSQARGGGAGSTQGQSSAGQGNEGGMRPEQRPMSREQADRILSAIEQDERDLTREKLKKGQRRTPVARDW